MPHNRLSDGFRDIFGSGIWSPACTAQRLSHWGAAEGHQSPTMCHICLPCSCCCQCRLQLTHHPCHSSSSSQRVSSMPTRQLISLPRQASVSSNQVHSAAAVNSGMVMMQRSKRSRALASSARQWWGRAVPAAGPVECIKSRMTARCAFSSRFHAVDFAYSCALSTLLAAQLVPPELLLAWRLCCLQGRLHAYMSDQVRLADPPQPSPGFICQGAP